MRDCCGLLLIGVAAVQAVAALIATLSMPVEKQDISIIQHLSNLPKLNCSKYN
ncbi:MAG: hypothetical protein WBA39_11365 [Rivularia sp. (in: cyanobacteria)]